MTKAYINALSESPKGEILDWLIKVDAENDELRQKLETVKRDLLKGIVEEVGNYRAELEVSGKSVEASKLAWTIEMYVRDLLAEASQA